MKTERFVLVKEVVSKVKNIAHSEHKDYEVNNGTFKNLLLFFHLFELNGFFWYSLFFGDI